MNRHYKNKYIFSEGMIWLTSKVQREIQALFPYFPELQQDIPIEKIGKEIEIIGVGSAGIVLEDKRMNTVMKVGRNEEEHAALKEERENHEIFSYLINKERKRENIPQWIKIPKTMKIFGSIYKMRKINGPSLYQLDFLFNPYLKDYRDRILVEAKEKKEEKGYLQKKIFIKPFIPLSTFPNTKFPKCFPLSDLKKQEIEMQNWLWISFFLKKQRISEKCSNI
jgi:hypothetical protein